MPLKRYLERFGKWFKPHAKSKKFYLGTAVFSLMALSLIVFLSLKFQPAQPERFALPDDFGVLGPQTRFHPDSPFAPAIQAWRRGSPWLALELFDQLAETRLGLEERLACLNYSGQIRLALGEVQKAEKVYRSARDLRANVGSFYGLARIAELRQELALAEESYQAALNLRPDFALAWRRLGDVKRAQDDLAGALTAYKTAFKLNDLDFNRYRLAEALNLSGEKGLAGEHFRYLFENANHPVLIGYSAARLADLVEDEGDHSRAIELYRLAVSRVPSEPVFKHNLGLILLGARRLDEAILVYQDLRDESLAKKDPQVLRIRQAYARALGETWYDEGDPEQSLKFYLESGSEDPEAVLTIGDLYYLKGEFKKALEFFQRVIDYLPTGQLHQLARINSGVIWLKIQEPLKAKEAFELALKHDPKNARARCNLGLAQLEIKDLGGARDSFKQAWEDEPELSEALALWISVAPEAQAITILKERATDWFEFQSLARLQHKTRDYKSAILALKEALSLATSPDEKDASRLLLVRCYLAQERPEEARAQLELLKERALRDPFWFYLMGLLEWKTAAYTRAEEYFQLARGFYASPRLAAEIRYWNGNLSLRAGELSKALNFYKEALRFFPGHTAASLNASWCANQLAANKSGKGRQY